MTPELSDVVPILLYHSVTPSPGADAFAVRLDDFRRDMAEVAATGRIAMTADEYRRWSADDARPPIRPVLVTFDDGFADYADRALPVLAEHGMRSTLFVTSGWVDRPGMLSRRAVEDLARGTTEIGAHTVSHPHLDLLDPVEARGELRYAREFLEDRTGEWVTSLAYPHGSHSRRTKTLARESGYLTAHAVKNALSHTADDEFAIGRYTVHAGTTRAEVRAVLAGRGVPRSWRRERLRTAAFRHVRRLRGAPAVDPRQFMEDQQKG